MKRSSIGAALALGLVLAGSACATEQEQSFMVDLHAGYAVLVYVGDTPAGYAKAQVLANRWEAQRHLVLVPQSIKAIAVDNSQGTANQMHLNVPDKAVAYVHIH